MVVDKMIGLHDHKEAIDGEAVVVVVVEEEEEVDTVEVVVGVEEEVVVSDLEWILMPN